MDLALADFRVSSAMDEECFVEKISKVYYLILNDILIAAAHSEEFLPCKSHNLN